MTRAATHITTMTIAIEMNSLGKRLQSDGSDAASSNG